MRVVLMHHRRTDGPEQGFEEQDLTLTIYWSRAPPTTNAFRDIFLSEQHIVSWETCKLGTGYVH